MTIEILVCRADGTQSLELREVGDNWSSPGPAPAEEVTTAQLAAAIAEGVGSL